ncbi:MAG: cell shape determination protein CcmA [Nitrospira sp. UW-LDO-01]|jgi:cytoskeletal protein CcmA (bactofilin family)|nr:polymer-forming cytoskeletal protein [Nitrospira sp.]OYT19008.1 MAG: cell shape determination protein CcmA [Nitrospira sp. UW-LDO-01]
MWDKKRESDSDNGHFTVLGKDVTFKGVVHFHSTVQLDSSIEGEIHAKGMLVIGENATIRGTIVAETIVTRGKIHGNVTATSKIQLLKPAVVLGDISAPSFSMEEGAFFKGSIDMGSHPVVDEFQQTPLVLTEAPQRLSLSRPILIESEQESS